MKFLLLGATGNMGSRLLQALLAHDHQVVTLVRSEAKLRAMFAEGLLEHVTVIAGDVTDSAAVQHALVQHGCEALVMAAGLAAIWPWQAPRMPQVIAPVVQAAVGASTELGRPLRCWFMAGLGLLDVPGTETQLCSYMPVFREHYLTYERLSRCSTDNLVWSLLCPSMMEPADKSAPKLSGRSRGNSLLASVDSPPAWEASWVTRIPLVGPLLDFLPRAGGYNTLLEDCADLIVADLAQGLDSPYAGRRVGVMNDPKSKTS